MHTQVNATVWMHGRRRHVVVETLPLLAAHVSTPRRRVEVSFDERSEATKVHESEMEERERRKLTLQGFFMRLPAFLRNACLPAVLYGCGSACITLRDFPLAPSARNKPGKPDRPKDFSDDLRGLDSDALMENDTMMLWMWSVSLSTQYTVLSVFSPLFFDETREKRESKTR